MEPDEVLESIAREAPARGWPIIGASRGKLLDEVVIKYRPSAVLEVGTNVGYSAIRMARLLGAGGKLTCVEVKEEVARTARSNFERAGLSNRIVVAVGDALEVLPRLQGSLDMVFLDAVKSDYLTYLKSVEHLLHRGSVVVADNVRSFKSETKDYLDYVRNSGGYSSTYREAPPDWGTGEGDAVEISLRL